MAFDSTGSKLFVAEELSFSGTDINVYNVLDGSLITTFLGAGSIFLAISSTDLGYSPVLLTASPYESIVFIENGVEVKNLEVQRKIKDLETRA